jgi:hypothetical protein
MSVYSPERREAARQRALAAFQRAPVDPTQEEIAAACEEIQAGWSRVERRLRLAWAHSVGNVGLQERAERPRWTPPELRCVDFCDG